MRLMNPMKGIISLAADVHLFPDTCYANGKPALDMGGYLSMDSPPTHRVPMGVSGCVIFHSMGKMTPFLWSKMGIHWPVIRPVNTFNRLSFFQRHISSSMAGLCQTSRTVIPT